MLRLYSPATRTAPRRRLRGAQQRRRWLLPGLGGGGEWSISRGPGSGSHTCRSRARSASSGPSAPRPQPPVPLTWPCWSSTPGSYLAGSSTTRCQVKEHGHHYHHQPFPLPPLGLPPAAEFPPSPDLMLFANGTEYHDRSNGWMVSYRAAARTQQSQSSPRLQRPEAAGTPPPQQQLERQPSAPQQRQAQAPQPLQSQAVQHQQDRSGALQNGNHGEGDQNRRHQGTAASSQGPQVPQGVRMPKSQEMQQELLAELQQQKQRDPGPSEIARPPAPFPGPSASGGGTPRSQPSPDLRLFSLLPPSLTPAGLLYPATLSPRRRRPSLQTPTAAVTGGASHWLSDKEPLPTFCRAGAAAAAETHPGSSNGGGGSKYFSASTNGNGGMLQGTPLPASSSKAPLQMHSSAPQGASAAGPPALPKQVLERLPREGFVEAVAALHASLGRTFKVRPSIPSTDQSGEGEPPPRGSRTTSRLGPQHPPPPPPPPLPSLSYT